MAEATKSRRELLVEMMRQCGSLVEVVDERDGWPGLVRVKSSSKVHTVALHVGPVGLSHRGRDDTERRFQNPGQGRPVQLMSGSTPLLLGFWTRDAQNSQDRQPVFVGMEVTPHRLEAATRQSYFVPLEALGEAQRSGWAEHLSTSDESIVVFHPALLPIYTEIREAGLRLDGSELSSIARAAGLGEAGSDISSEARARRAALVLVRRRTFSRDVIAAYGGLCAMCGLNFGLLEGAHILPALVTGSPDEVWNGLALCRNHHAAYDRHKVWIHPSKHSIVLHPDFSLHSALNPTCKAFVANTESKLRAPISASASPKSRMFEKRYQHFRHAYEWASG